MHRFLQLVLSLLLLLGITIPAAAQSPEPVDPAPVVIDTLPSADDWDLKISVEVNGIPVSGGGQLHQVGDPQITYWESPYYANIQREVNLSIFQVHVNSNPIGYDCPSTGDFKLPNDGKKYSITMACYPRPPFKIFHYP